jgi:alanyl-tRNA synthetase
MNSINDIRATFLDFFKRNDHAVLPSSPLIPHNDPTLMFTNSGMVQFKNVFTGTENPKALRATTSQKCVRAGGKHNDLDNVGYTARHHTFFEMLGNFSFGDYFKERAITLAWELLTKDFGLPKEKLLVTVYHTDDEALNLWKKIAGLTDERIIRIPTNDNFWRMGDVGPCGPCSEIFFDHGEHIPGGPPGSPEEDGDRFIEIWNLVFMQYEETSSGERLSLPKPSIDTGMGLERVSAVLQGVHDNYDTDLFRTLIEASKHFSKTGEQGEHRVSHRVIADHLRSSCFLMADGLLPSNEGRGYVLRRIMRRAMRHAYQLGCKEPLLYRLVPSLTRVMGDAYPELRRAEALMTESLKLEEERFQQTLGRGLKLLDEATTGLSSGDRLAGEVAFKLYDTYGFPLDLTEDILKSRHISVDHAGFEASMAQQKAAARAAWSGSGEKAVEKLWFDVKETHGATEFLGYHQTKLDGIVLAIVKDGNEVDAAKAGDTVKLIVNQTPFYGESGGQMGDSGVIIKQGQAIAQVSDTHKLLDALHIHLVAVENGEIRKGDAITLQVDVERRNKLRANHSATHLLHKVLRDVLGEHVTQKGSLVSPDRLRFDISHPKALDAETLAEVERRVNKLIWRNSEVTTELMTPDDAITKGAMALFGEKYGDEVRVVSMGLHANDGTEEKIYSVELCGGTHVSHTGDIGLFKILSESAIAAGVRRIEAVTGAAAIAYLNEQESRVKELAALLKCSPADVQARVEALNHDKRRLEKELADTRKALAMGAAGGEEAETVHGVQFISRLLVEVPAKDLRGIADDLRKNKEASVVFIGSHTEGKASVLVAVTADIAAQVNAVELVKIAASATGGSGGGGKPDFAQAGGPEGSKLEEARQAVKHHLSVLASGLNVQKTGS